MATILIVDDESSVRKYLRTMLGQRGYRLLEACNGAEGLQYVQTEHPDLVITDLVMPTMSGFELAREIRNDPSSFQIPVIFMTGAFERETVVPQAKLCGVHYVVPKPCSQKELVPIVEQALLESPSPKMTVSAEDFDVEQFRLLYNTLAAKVRQLEKVNLQLQLEAADRKRSEQALQTSEAKYRGIFDHAVEGMFRTTPEGRFLDMNPALAHILGYASPAEALANLNDIGHQLYVDPSLRKKFIQRLEVEGMISSFELEIRRSDGSVVWVSESARGIRDSSGVLDSIEGTVEDITERRQAEEALRTSNRRLHLLSGKVIEIQENERRHLAHELHDEIGQVLSAISVNLKVVKSNADAASALRLDESIGMVDRALQQVRDLSLDLRPSMLDDFGLEAALRWYVNRLAERAGLIADFEGTASSVDVPNVVRNVCFRVAQESLTNVVRHGRARAVQVRFQALEDEVRLEIQDNGVGFDVSAARDRALRGGSLGLLGIYERVELLGGNVEIESQPGCGTTIRVQLPFTMRSSMAAQENA